MLSSLSILDYAIFLMCSSYFKAMSWFICRLKILTRWSVISMKSGWFTSNLLYSLFFSFTNAFVRIISDRSTYWNDRFSYPFAKDILASNSTDFAPSECLSIDLISKTEFAIFSDSLSFEKSNYTFPMIFLIYKTSLFSTPLLNEMIWIAFWRLSLHFS